MQLLVSAALSLVTGYIGGSLSESRRRRLERRTMLRALSVEIGDIAETCDRTHFRMNSFVTDHSVGEPLPRSNLSSNDWAIYSANISKLGLIHSFYINSVVDFYTRCRSMVDEEIFIRDNEVIPERLARHVEEWKVMSEYGRYINRGLGRVVN